MTLVVWCSSESNFLGNLGHLWRTLSSEMWRCAIWLNGTDVSERNLLPPSSSRKSQPHDTDTDRRRFLWNTGIFSPHCSVSHPRRQQWPPEESKYVRLSTYSFIETGHKLKFYLVRNTEGLHWLLRDPELLCENCFTETVSRQCLYTQYSNLRLSIMFIWQH
jgi:hypothetical protein